MSEVQTGNIRVGDRVRVVIATTSPQVCSQEALRAMIGNDYSVNRVDASDNTLRLEGVVDIPGVGNGYIWVPIASVELVQAQPINSTDEVARDLNGDVITAGDSVVVIRYVEDIMWSRGDFAALRQKTLVVASADVGDNTVLLNTARMVDDFGPDGYWIPAAAVQRVDTTQPEPPPLVPVQREAPPLVPVQREAPPLVPVRREVPPLTPVVREAQGGPQEASGDVSEAPVPLPPAAAATSASETFAEVWSRGQAAREGLLGRRVVLVRSNREWRYWVPALDRFLMRSGEITSAHLDTGEAISISGCGGYNFDPSCVEFEVSTQAAETTPEPTTPEFRVGDQVRIVRAVYGREQRGNEPRDPDCGYNWVPGAMDRNIGREGRVISASPGGVTVSDGGGHLGYSPLSLELISRAGQPATAPALTPVDRRAAPAVRARRTVRYVTVGGVCETDTVLILGVRDIATKEGSLFYKEKGGWEVELREPVLASLCRAAGRDLEETKRKDLAERTGTSIRSGQEGPSRRLQGSSVLQITEADRELEEDEDEDDIEYTAKDLFWLAEYEIEVDADGSLELDVSSLADNFFSM